MKWIQSAPQPELFRRRTVPQALSLQQRRRQRKMTSPSSILIHSWTYLLLLLLYIPAFSTVYIHAFSSDKNFGYTPSSDVSRYLKLALDIQLMRQITSFEEKQYLYENGNHSIISLASLSLTAGNTMADVPIYNLYLNSFRVLGITNENDSLGSFDGKPVEQYADTLIEDLFVLEIPRIEATATVVHSVYMSFWSFLYQILNHCENMRSTNTTIAESSSTRDMLASLDAAVALYVGEGQIRNDSAGGYMIYSLAQAVGDKFNQKSNSEAIVNTKMMNLFISIQKDIQSGMCTKPEAFDSDYRTLRSKVYDMMKQSNIVLLQLLLHYVQVIYDNAGNENGITNDFVELVALAINPQIDACHPGLSNNITDLLIRHSISTASNPITDDGRDNIISTIQNSYSCLHVTCADVGTYGDGVIPTCTNDMTIQALYGSYLPRSVAAEDVAIIDRDIRQINIFLQMNKWDIVQNYYKYGWNTYFSLYDIATGGIGGNFSRAIQASEAFRLYDDYNKILKSSYGGTGSELIEFALQTPAPYDEIGTADGMSAISDATRLGIISGTLETYVMWVGAFSQLQAAVNACEDNSATSSDIVLQYWDNAAAFMIGSSSEGGKEDDIGQSIFAISKRFCVVFDTCEPKGSISNTVILAALNAGRDALVSNVCETASEIMKGKMTTFSLIPIIQGLIYYTVETARGERSNTGIDSKGYLIAYTMALLPHIEKADGGKAIILNAAIELDKPINLAETFDALRAVLQEMDIDCGLIGKIQINGNSTGVCAGDAQVGTLPPEVDIPPTASPSMSPIYIPKGEISEDGLAWGRYIFANETIAIMDANFSYDIRDMWFADTTADAESVYLNASEHAINGLYGYSNVQSLQDFSTKVSLFMNQDPVYNFFRVALFDDDTFDQNASGVNGGWPYADAVEQLAVSPANGNNAQLGSKAVAVMEFYMMIIHRLYESIRRCDRGESFTDLIDAAVGLWIGRDQGEGKFNSGWSMYSVAQDAADFYGRPETEADANIKLMLLFKDAQKLTMSCATNREAPITLRAVVDKLVRYLSIPLLQHLLFHMSDNNLEFVELYALSFIPLTISVDEGAYMYLRDALFQGFSWESTVDDSFTSILGKVLHAMRFTCDDLGDVSDAEDNLKHLVSVLCNEIQDSYNSTYIAAYETSYDVSEWARFDLDIHQIDIFLRVNAFDLAYDVYANGRNSLDDDGKCKTLKFLTSTSELADAGEVYLAYKEYYRQDNYADFLITDAMLNRTTGSFKGYTRRQLSESIRRTFQTMAVYLPIHALLRSAVDECRTNDDGEQPTNENGDAIAGQEAVDQAVALLVGSIEGPYSGGSLFGSGKMIYSLGKEMCRPFSTCDIHDDSHVNIFLLFGFSSMKEYLDGYQCDEAEEVLLETILPALPVALIQGAVYYSIQSGPIAIVTSDVLAKTILPQIKATSAENVQSIYDKTVFDVTDPRSQSQATEVVIAFKSILEPLDVDCTFVGALAATNGNFSFCDETIIPITNTTTDLPDNLYGISTDVQEKANIAIDIKQMLENIKLNRLARTESLYNDGENYEVFDASGEIVGIISIASFSTSARETMKENPIFQIVTHALQDDSGKFMGHPVSQFADTIVQQMFGKSNPALAVEAAVALNIWMELTNELFILVARCRESEIIDNEGQKLADGAVAYWVGGGQLSTSRDTGYSLYALAETVDENFNADDVTKVARTNINVLRLFNEVKEELSVTGVCSADSTAARRLRRMVDQIVSLMIAVIVKALIHFLLENDERDRVYIYAHAFVPLVAGCSPDKFSYLKEKLLLDKYVDTDIDNILETIRSTFPCLGIRCADVGTHFSEKSSSCSDPTSSAALADYKPSTNVHEYAKLDLDTLELDILLQQNAYAAAFELYSFGKHASLNGTSDDTSLSLSDLATSDDRSIVPEYESYVRFYNGDPKFSNALVRAALDSSGTTEEQRRIQVVGISQYMIIYVTILQAMHSAIQSCQPNGDTRSGLSVVGWDRAAALIIGHLEGSVEGGSGQGRLLWSLSKRYCNEFRTCSDEEISSTRTNDKITTYLFIGRSAVLDGSCDELKSVTAEISSLLLAPIFQGLFSATSKLSQRNIENEEVVQAEAYIFAQVVLPLINKDKSDENFRTIQDSFPLSGKALRHGFGNAVSALVASMNDLGVKCQYVGASNEIDTCSGQTSSKKSGIISGVIVGMVTVALISLFVIIRRKRKFKRDTNSAPIFKMSNGEFNHHSELVCSRTEQPRIMSVSSQRGESNSSDTDLMNDASDAMVEEEEMGVTQEAITKVDDTDEEYVRAIAAALHDRSMV